MQVNRSDFTPFIIGVAGGSGSGKTTVSQRLQTMVGAAQLAYIQHDNYYRDFIVPGGGENRVAMEMIVSRIQTVLLQRGA